MTEDFYYVGGSIPFYKQEVYVSRKADKDLLESLKNGKFSYVFNSRQIGKSSLMIQIKEKLKENKDIICIDYTLQNIPRDESNFYNTLIQNISEKIGEKFIAVPKDREIGCNDLTEFFQKVLSSNKTRKFIIFIDEIDVLFDFTWRDNFFGLIRAYSEYKAHSDKQEYRRLTFCLLGVATPFDLIKDNAKSPFNIQCKRIELEGFKSNECSNLAAGLKDVAADSELLMEWIIDWTGGQPFLTQKLCQLVATSGLNFSTEETEKIKLDSLVEKKIIENGFSEDKDDPIHLRTIKKRLIEDKQVHLLLNLYQRILNEGSIESKDDYVYQKLRLSGLVVKRERRLEVFNEIYKRVFNQDWIEKELNNIIPIEDPENFYKVGGAIDFDKQQVYVSRKADDDLLESLKNRQFSYVFNSRQMGKSSLMIQIKEKLKENKDIICIDYTLQNRPRDESDFYNTLIQNITEKIGEKFIAIPKDREIGCNDLTEFFQKVLSSNKTRKIIVFIDEIDVFFDFPWRDNFFSLIRTYSEYKAHSEKQEYRRLTFCLLGVATPFDLIKDNATSPFNIQCKRIELEGFKSNECSNLAAGLKNVAAEPELLMKWIIDWTGGQPFLTQKLCHLVITSGLNFSAEERDKIKLDNLVQEKIIDNGLSQEKDDPVHLGTIRKRLIEDKQVHLLLNLYQRILNEDSIESKDDYVYQKLRLSGLVVKREERLEVFNEIYKKVFNQDWIEKELNNMMRPEKFDDLLNRIVEDEDGIEAIIVFNIKRKLAQHHNSNLKLTNPELYDILFENRGASKALINFHFLENLPKAIDTFGKETNTGELDYAIFCLSQGVIVAYITPFEGQSFAVCYITTDASLLASTIIAAEETIKIVKQRLEEGFAKY